MRRFLKKASKILLCALCACAPADQEEKQAADTAAVNREMWHWSTQITEQGIFRAQVQADFFQQMSEDESARFSDGVRVVFFDAHGDAVSRLNAKWGKINASGGDIKLVEQVRMVARNGTQLLTDSLRWQRDEDRIMGEGYVMIFWPDGKMTGVGFKVSPDLKKLDINNTRRRRKEP